MIFNGVPAMVGTHRGFKMNMGKVNYIKNAIRSITDSTEKKIILKREGYKFTGLCSEYLTHQNMGYTYGHRGSRAIKFENDKYVFVLISKPGDPVGDNISYGILPMAIFIGLAYYFKNLGVALPDWVFNEDSVHVVIPNLFTGYDDEGKPLFNYSLWSEVKLDGGVDCGGRQIDQWLTLNAGEPDEDEEESTDEEASEDISQ